jgi:hypothetical protein
VTLPLSLRAEPLSGDPSQVALFYGPVALTARLGDEGLLLPYVANQTRQARCPVPAGPTFVTERDDWLRQIEKVGGSPLLFRTRGLARPADVVLAPFHAVHHERLATYFPLLTTAAWETRQADLATLEQELADARARAVDRVDAGHFGSERVHQIALVGDATQTGTLSGRTWRQCLRGSSFAYTRDNG